MKEELTREVTRWCVSFEEFIINKGTYGDFEEVVVGSSLEYFITEKEAEERAEEITERQEDYPSFYRLNVECEEGHWITEREYQNYYADEIEGLTIID